jgi:hypothetical protein
LHSASENHSAAAEQHAEHGATPESGGSHGQSQRELHAASENHSAAAEQHAEHDATPESGGSHGQSQRELHAASENGSVAAEHDAKQGNGADPGPSQRDLHTASANASNNPHSESKPNAPGPDHSAPADTGHAEMAATPALGDSFQFKSEMASSKRSDDVDLANVGHDPESTADDRHVVGHDGPAAIQDTEPAGISLAEQNAADHATGGAHHHVPHDLIV